MRGAGFSPTRLLPGAISLISARSRHFSGHWSGQHGESAVLPLAIYRWGWSSPLLAHHRLDGRPLCAQLSQRAAPVGAAHGAVKIRRRSAIPPRDAYTLSTRPAGAEHRARRAGAQRHELISRSHTPGLSCIDFSRAGAQSPQARATRAGGDVYRRSR